MKSPVVPVPPLQYSKPAFIYWSILFKSLFLVLCPSCHLCCVQLLTGGQSGDCDQGIFL